MGSLSSGNEISITVVYNLSVSFSVLSYSGVQQSLNSSGRVVVKCFSFGGGVGGKNFIKF